MKWISLLAALTFGGFMLGCEDRADDNVGNEIGENVEEAGNEIQDFAQDTADETKDMAEDAAEGTRDLANEAADEAEEAGDRIQARVDE